MTAGRFEYITAKFTGSDILQSAITTNLPFATHAEFPTCAEADAGTNDAYDAWVTNGF